MWIVPSSISDSIRQRLLTDGRGTLWGSYLSINQPRLVYGCIDWEISRRSGAHVHKGKQQVYRVVLAAEIDGELLLYVQECTAPTMLVKLGLHLDDHGHPRTPFVSVTGAGNVGAGSRAGVEVVPGFAVGGLW